MAPLSEKYRIAHQESRSQPDPHLWKRVEKRLDHASPIRRLGFTRMSVAASITVLLLTTIALLYVLQNNKPANLVASNKQMQEMPAYAPESAQMQHAPLAELADGIYSGENCEIELKQDAATITEGGNSTQMSYERQTMESGSRIFYFKHMQTSMVLRLDSMGQLSLKKAESWIPLLKK
ncbi:MAG: hypothetical protein ABIV51_08770 [Saprospiraceae bacterium]